MISHSSTAHIEEDNIVVELFNDKYNIYTIE